MGAIYYHSVNYLIQIIISTCLYECGMPVCLYMHVGMRMCVCMCVHVSAHDQVCVCMCMCLLSQDSSVVIFHAVS